MLPTDIIDHTNHGPFLAISHAGPRLHLEAIAKFFFHGLEGLSRTGGHAAVAHLASVVEADPNLSNIQEFAPLDTRGSTTPASSKPFARSSQLGQAPQGGNSPS